MRATSRPAQAVSSSPHSQAPEETRCATAQEYRLHRAACNPRHSSAAPSIRDAVQAATIETASAVLSPARVAVSLEADTQRPRVCRPTSGREEKGRMVVQRY